MSRKKYDIDYADDVKMWELVSFNEASEEWECMGIYAEREEQADALANMFEANYRKEQTNEQNIYKKRGSGVA